MHQKEIIFSSKDHPVRGSPEYNLLILGLLNLRQTFEMSHLKRRFVIGPEELESDDRLTQIRDSLLNSPEMLTNPLKIIEGCLELVYLNYLKPIDTLKNNHVPEDLSYTPGESYLEAATRICRKAIEGTENGLNWVAESHNTSPQELRKLWDSQMVLGLERVNSLKEFLKLLESE